jgi:hypothetical protein
MDATAALIPWAGDRNVPLRLLAIDLRATTLAKGVSPAVLVDGRQYVVDWGRVALEVPADRPVHVCVLALHRRPLGVASLVLMPDREPALEYSAPSHLSMAGELGAPGTTSHRGRGLQAGLLTVLALVVAAFIAVVVTLLVALG